MHRDAEFKSYKMYKNNIFKMLTDKKIDTSNIKYILYPKYRR